MGTIIATILNVINLRSTYDECDDDDDDADACWGPIVKYCVVDAFFGIACGLLLIFGSRSRNSCLLIAWVIIIMTWKYVWVVASKDWTNIEDWVSIGYLLFYI